jgi:hypothetical protein
MKVTTSAAMRARDVSRPHAEHLASAEAAEASAASSRPAAPAVPAVPADAPEPVDAAGASAVRDGEVLRKAAGGEVLREAAAGDGSGPGRPGGTRRRWRSRGSGRGRASSR